MATVLIYLRLHGWLQGFWRAPDRVLHDHPADTGKTINLQHPDHREQRFLRRVAVRCLTACDFGLVSYRQLFPSGSEATWYWKPPLCKKLPACAT
eukprot:6175237-Pleurochrysis_carterae.AAC.1